MDESSHFWYVPISIRLDPVVIEWAKKQADLKGVGYQTVINNILRGASKRGVRVKEEYEYKEEYTVLNEL